MTRHEIEKRCREEMQQTIPDKDALWARIENHLPEQAPMQIEQSQPRQSRSILYRTMAAAACFLFVIACARLWHLKDSLPSQYGESNKTHYMDDASSKEYNDYDYNDFVQDNAADEAEDSNSSAGAKADHPASGKEETLHYSEIAVPQNHDIADQVQTELLGTEEAYTETYFHEPDVLSQTEAFVHVIIRNGTQAEDGRITYEMNILEHYGTAQDTDNLFITTDSPYIMEQWHEYWLPLYRNSAGEWMLSYEGAPQIESTQDGQILFHNGWASLVQEQNIPVLCDICSENDYFYDRMYLTDTETLRALLIQWETEKYT